MSRLHKDNAFPKTATACQSSGRFHFHGAQPSSVVRRISIIGFVFLAGEHLASWLVLSRRPLSDLKEQAVEFTRNPLDNQWVAIMLMLCGGARGGEVNLNQCLG